MSSTNKTEHYILPQFIGSDIPPWLGDFNSAMTAIDSGINAAATSASGAATTAALALEAVNRCPFPIGYGGFFNIDPNSIYAGTTWEQKKDVFILASGDTYGAGSTGGEAQHTLTANEMPDHNHSEFINIENVGKVAIGGGSSSGKQFYEILNSAAHGRAGGGSATSTGHAGGGAAHNNMPPYYAMPFWIRTA